MVRKLLFLLSLFLIGNFCTQAQTTNARNTYTCICFADGKQIHSETLEVTSEGTFIFDVDLNRLSIGLHNLQMVVMSPNGELSNIKEGWFYRIASNAEYQGCKLLCHIDGDEYGLISISENGGIYKVDLDTAGISTGIHSLDITFILHDGEVSNTVRSWFYKTPVPPGVCQYEYWFNQNYSDSKTVSLKKPESSFSLIDLIEVPDLPFDSKNYAFSINEGQPSVNAVHDISFRFTESDGRNAFQQVEFINSQVSKDIVNPVRLVEGLNEIERNSEIKWFTFDGEVGDSVVLTADSKLMFELFSPSGKTLLKKKGVGTETVSTSTLQEKGTYYFAAHDFYDQNSTARVYFEQVPRNAILWVNPSITASSYGFTHIEIGGNGFLNVSDVYMVSPSGAQLNAIDFSHYDNYNLYVTFPNEGTLESGDYDLFVEIDDEIDNKKVVLSRKGAVTILDTDAKADIKVEVVPSKKASTPYMVEIRITNDSDVPCWGIPIQIACERKRGTIGYTFYFLDLIDEISDIENIVTWYDTDNLLGTGVDGLYMPFVLDYMQPHETRSMRVGIRSQAHEKVGLYAWAGEPFNEEIMRLLSTPIESLCETPLIQSNTISFQMYLFLNTLLNKYYPTEPAKVNTRWEPTTDNDWVLEDLQELVPDLIGRYTPFHDSSNYASQLAGLARALGYAFAGLNNKGPCDESKMYFRKNGIPGETLYQQIKYLETSPNYSGGMDPDLKIHYIQATTNLARLVRPEVILEEAGHPLLGTLVGYFTERMSPCENPRPVRHEIECMQSGDPNMIYGHTDPTGGKFIGIDDTILPYTIEFENDPAIANAAASFVEVTNHLDPEIFNLESFKAKSITLGSHSISLPEKDNFVLTIDMRPEIQCITEIRQEFSPITGVAKWTFKALDPYTLDPVENSLQGFLPVNLDGVSGTGTISYMVGLNDGLAHLSPVANKASIIFDDNKPIETPKWVNVTDYIRPSASILGYVYDSGRYVFEISQSDEGSGIKEVNLYVSTDNGENWIMVNTSANGNHLEWIYPEAIDNVTFMVKATDCAGNIQVDSSNQPDDAFVESIIGVDNNIEETWYDVNGIKSIPYTSKGKVTISNKGRKKISK